MANNEEEARKKRSQVRQAAFGTFDRNTGKSTTTYNNEALKQGAQGSKSVTSGNNVAIYSGFGRPESAIPKATAGTFGRTPLGAQDISNIMRAPTAPAQRTLGTEFAAGPSTPMNMDIFPSSQVPRRTVTDINARQRQMIPYQGGMQMRSEKPLPTYDDRTNVRDIAIRPTERLSPGVDWTKMEGISGISDVYKGTPRNADIIQGYGRAIYSDAPVLEVGRDNRAGGFTLGGGRVSPSPSGQGQVERTTSETGVGFGTPRSFEERAATGDVFSYGAAGEMHRNIQDMRNQARLGVARGELHPEQAAALMREANAQEQFVRGLGIQKQLAGAEEGSATAAQMAARVKGIGDASKAGIEAGKLDLAERKFQSERGLEQLKLELGQGLSPTDFYKAMSGMVSAGMAGPEQIDEMVRYAEDLGNPQLAAQLMRLRGQKIGAAEQALGDTTAEDQLRG